MRPGFEPPVSPVDACYEWLLSDSPAAQQERTRRRSENIAHAERERAEVEAWCRRTLSNDAAPQNLRDPAEAMQRIASRIAERARIEGCVTDGDWVRSQRSRLEISLRVAGDDSYRYPDRYLGIDAADQPVPDEHVPVSLLRQGQFVRLGPDRAATQIVEFETCDACMFMRTADGQRRRYPFTAWMFRVHDDRYVPEGARNRDIPRRLTRDRSDIVLER